MNVKWIGALCVIVGCGGYGFLMTVQHMSKIRFLKSFLDILDFMECQLQFRATALPQLCRQIAEQSQGFIRQIFLAFAEEMDAQIAPSAYLCMASALGKSNDADDFIHGILSDFSKNLGAFDIAGQIKGLEHMRSLCNEKLNELTTNRESRLRSYQTLSLCAGAALVILLV